MCALGTLVSERSELWPFPEAPPGPEPLTLFQRHMSSLKVGNVEHGPLGASKHCRGWPCMTLNKSPNVSARQLQSWVGRDSFPTASPRAGERFRAPQAPAHTDCPGRGPSRLALASLPTREQRKGPLPGIRQFGAFHEVRAFFLLDVFRDPRAEILLLRVKMALSDPRASNQQDSRLRVPRLPEIRPRSDRLQGALFRKGRPEPSHP